MKRPLHSFTRIGMRRLFKWRKEKREHVMLVCRESGDIHYTSRNRLGAEVELMKYNPMAAQSVFIHPRKRLQKD